MSNAALALKSNDFRSWMVAAVGDVCRLINGRAYKKAELLADGRYRVLRVGNFFTNDHWYFSDLELEANKYCEDGDLLYAWSASFGPRIWTEEKVIYHYHIWKVQPDATKVSRDFLFYFFEWDKDLIRKEQGAGATMTHVSKESMEARAIPLPPLEEQKRIVAVLDQAFAALDRARANAEANLADAQELFDNTLLAVFDELLPKAAMMTLGDAALDFSRGKSKHRPRNDPALYGGDYPFIQTGDIRRSIGSVREYAQTYNDVGLAQSKLWPAGTVCITIAANIAETGVLEFDGCFPDSVIGMVPNPKIANAYYVEYMLRYFAKELKLQGKGSAQDNINLATFENAKFPFPSIERQVGVVEKLDEIAAGADALRANYKTQLTALAVLRQSLLQKAFAGELA